MCSSFYSAGSESGEVDFSSVEREHSLLHDFLKDVFHREVDNRPSAKELLKHSFITDVRPSGGDFSAIIETDDQEQLSSLVSSFDINGLEFAEGKHPLDVAVSCQRLECLKILLEHGKAEIGKGSRLLVTSVGQGSGDIAECLIKQTDVDVNELDSYGNTALKLACRRNNKRLIRLLSDQQGVDANIPSSDGSTVLHEAATNCASEDFECILQTTKADLNCIDHLGRTVLMAAAAAGNLDIVKIVVNLSPEQVNMEDNLHLTALHQACSKNTLDVIDYLLFEKAKVTNKSGWTVLHVASFYNQSKVVQHLLTRNVLACNVQTKDKLQTPLHFACETDSLEAVKCLIRHSVDVESKDGEKRTPLHWASAFNSVRVAKYLLEEKLAKVDATDVYGYTPLHFACERGYLDMVRLLIDNKAAVNAKTIHGHEPLHKACSKGHLD